VSPKWHFPPLLFCAFLCKLDPYARMEAMELYVTVGPEGEFEIPEAFCKSLGIVDGTRIAMQMEGGCLILTPERPLAEQPSAEQQGK
jgi:hypothetical protein